MHILQSCLTCTHVHVYPYVYRQMAERSVQEFKSEIAIGLDDMQPTAQQGDKTLGAYILYTCLLMYSHIYMPVKGKVLMCFKCTCLILVVSPYT